MSAGSLPQAVGAITVGAGARPVTQCSGNLRMSHWDGGQARRGGMRRWVRAERHSVAVSLVLFALVVRMGDEIGARGGEGRIRIWRAGVFCFRCRRCTRWCHRV